MLPVRVSEEGGIRALARVWSEWDGLVSRSGEPVPFLRASFLQAWWRSFGKGRPRLVLVRDDEGKLCGGALFAHHLTSFRGLPVRSLALAANVHSNRAMLVAEAGHERSVGIAIARWAFALRTSWTVLKLTDLPSGPVLDAFREELDRLGFPLGTKRGPRPPWIALEPTLRAFDATLATKWKSNLRNREKRFAQQGTVTHEVVRESVSDLAHRLDECFALEARAWKGAEGSAIDSDPRTHRFYRALATTAARDGTLRLHTLRLDGRLAAFQLDLEEGGVEYVLKIGYEPELAKLSPGALLLRRVIAGAIERGLSRVDLLGDDMPWKRDWTDKLRDHVVFYAFGRGALGKALHLAEFTVIPLLKRKPRAKPASAHDAPAPIHDAPPATASAAVPAETPVSAIPAPAPIAVSMTRSAHLETRPESSALDLGQVPQVTQQPAEVSP